jgi:FkbM family methyltransferase
MGIALPGSPRATTPSGTLAQLFARLPVALKGRVTQRLASVLCGKARDRTVKSNLGIASHLRFRVPLARGDLAFSRPELNLAERATLELAAQLARHCGWFLDVGANYGLFSAQLACQAGIPTIAIEADPQLCALLADNVAENFSNVSVVHAAASAHDAQSLVFHQNLDDDLSGSLSLAFADIHRTRKVEVPGLALSTLIAERGLDKVLVKVDVEGAGAEVWRGLAAAADKVEFLIMEIIQPESAARLPQQICDETGFRSYYIRDYDLICTDFASYDYVEPFWNWVFTRDDPAALVERLDRRFRVICT